jgi:hypothetical protein
MRRTAVLAGGALAVAVLASAPAVTARQSSVSWALIGDVPYGEAAIAQFPQLVEQINADPDVEIVAHSGDIKSGSSSCDDASLRRSFDLYQTFDDAFWYTPGDNEWTDCHRTAAGGFLPTERLDAVREIFFPQRSMTTGGDPIRVRSQAASWQRKYRPYVENTMFTRKCVTFGAVHVVGSDDNGVPWSQYPGDADLGLAPGDQPQLRTAEYTARRDAAVDWVNQIFDSAAARRSEGVVLMMQEEPAGDNAANTNFDAVRAAIIARATAFRKPVILAHGDDHVYTVTPGYAGVPNITRIENPGEATGTDRWVKMTAQCGSKAVFSWELKTFAVGPPPVIPEGPLTLGIVASAACAAVVWGIAGRRRRMAVAS